MMALDKQSDIYLAPSWLNRKPVFVGYALPRDSLHRHNALLNRKLLPLVLDLDLTLIEVKFGAGLNEWIEQTRAGSTTRDAAEELQQHLRHYSSRVTRCHPNPTHCEPISPQDSAESSRLERDLVLICIVPQPSQARTEE